jgi:hypothetical protein
MAAAPAVATIEENAPTEVSAANSNFYRLVKHSTPDA